MYSSVRIIESRYYYRLNSEYVKPFHGEDGVLFGDGRRGKGHSVRLLASGEARDHLSSQVGSLTVGNLVFGSRSARCGRSQTILISHKLISASCVRYFIFRKSQSVSVWPSYATRNSNQAPMSSAFMIECPLRLNNECNNRGRLCNEKYSYPGILELKKRRKKRAQDETRVHAYSPSR